MNMRIFSAAAAVLLLLGAPAAEAATFDLSYTLSTGSTISTVLDGDLAGGLFTVSGVESLAVNGTAVPTAYTAFSLDGLVMGGTGEPGAFAVDGSYIDLYLWDLDPDSATASVFAIGYGDAYASLVAPTVIVSADLGGSPVSEAFDTGSYSGHLEGALGAVPEPASWGLMILGFTGAGAVLRRRRHGVFAA
jgi:hypothetical protein